MRPGASHLSRRRQIPKKLSALVKGDLDWIVMKALEKDRSRRYDTASAFAADMRRCLTEEPVEARPPSASYYFRKLVRRNNVALTTAALVAGVLVLGTAFATRQTVRATREVTRATTAEAQTLAALRETERSRPEAVAARKKAEEFADGLQEATALVGRARPLIEQSRWTSAHAACTHMLDRFGGGVLTVRACALAAEPAIDPSPGSNGSIAGSNDYRAPLTA